MTWMNATVTPSQAGQSRQGVIRVHDLQTLEQALTAARTPITGNTPPVKGIELRADIFATDTIRLDGLPQAFVIFGGGYRLVARHSRPALRLAGGADLTIQDLSLRLMSDAPAILCDTAAQSTIVQNLRVEVPSSYLSPLFTTSLIANNLLVDGLAIAQAGINTIELWGLGTWSACTIRTVRGRPVQVIAPNLLRCRLQDVDRMFQLSPALSTQSSFAQIKAEPTGAFIDDLGAGNTLVDFSGNWASLWGSPLHAMLATNTGPGPGSRQQSNLPGITALVPAKYDVTGVNPDLQIRDTHIELSGNATGDLNLDGSSALDGQLLVITVNVATLGGLQVPSNSNQRLNAATPLVLDRYSSLTLIRQSAGFWQELSRCTP